MTADTLAGIVVTDANLPALATLTTTAPGQVVDGYRINGLVQVEHPGVEFRNCILEQGLQANHQQPVLDHCVIGNPAWLAQGHAPYAMFPEAGCPGTRRDYGIGYGGYTARYCRIFGFGDGAKANGDVLIEHSIIYSLYAYITTRNSNGTPKTWNHCDAVQVTQGSNVTLRGSVLLPPGYTPGGGVQSTSAAMIKADQGDINNVLIEDCLLGGSNSTTLYVSNGSIDLPTAGVVSNVTIRNNRFTRDTTSPRPAISDRAWPRGGQYGVITYSPSVLPSLTWEGNVWDDTGAVIPWGATGLFAAL